ncbi:MAG: glycosyltransferase [Chitinophagaceae bacterium]|nr:glycosyltransferase [Chitinophagaceae bacterium]MCW5926332.1 glycosyltransferase [Chitinophagaceae bacterium]
MFKNKKILIISPQPWEYLKVSKHYYAVELQKAGNQVYFLNPPSKAKRRGECSVSPQTKEGIIVIDYRPTFPMRWKHRLYLLFSFFMRLDCRKILSCIGTSPDIVWDFDPSLQFKDLRWFGAKLKIYHPVDMSPFLSGSSKNADVIFSVSNVILDTFRNNKTPFFFINHGISGNLAKLAEETIQQQKSDYDTLRVEVGYIGNLLMEFIDHEGFVRIIKENPHARFHIWGPYECISSTTTPIKDFIGFLLISPNVILHGKLPQEEILPRLQDIDVFFWSYCADKDPNKGSNSHKLLEYLSTGKVVVSTPVSTYQEAATQKVIVMGNNTSDFVSKFGEVIGHLDVYNSPELQIKRSRIALDNTYRKQLERIESICASLNGNASAR